MRVFEHQAPDVVLYRTYVFVLLFVVFQVAQCRVVLFLSSAWGLFFGGESSYSLLLFICFEQYFELWLVWSPIFPTDRFRFDEGMNSFIVLQTTAGLEGGEGVGRCLARSTWDTETGRKLLSWTNVNNSTHTGKKIGCTQRNTHANTCRHIGVEWVLLVLAHNRDATSGAPHGDKMCCSTALWSS